MARIGKQDGNGREIKSPTSPGRLLAAEKGAQAIALRIAGKTLVEIADAVGYKTKQGALLAIKAALARIAAPEVEEYRELMNARLEKIVAIWWPVMATPTMQVDGKEIVNVLDDRLKASTVILKAISDLRTLYGLDLAKPMPGSAENPLHIAPVFSGDLTEEQVDALIALDASLRGTVIDQEGNQV